MTESNIPPTTNAPAPPTASPATSLLAQGRAGNAYDGPPPTKDETTMAMLIYILGIVTNFIGPLILWLMKKDQSKFINDQGKEVLNFQITTAIAYIICIPLMFVIIGIILAPAVIICYLVFMIIGATKANKGIAYRFPFALRLIK